MTYDLSQEALMSMEYPRPFIPETAVPRARVPLLQHLVDTYASETNKTAAVWTELADDQLDFRPHARSSSVREILAHQLLSERRFFAEFIGLIEPGPELLLPPGDTPGGAAYVERLVALARPRLAALAAGDETFWLEVVPFFDVRRQRIWVFWRRVLHTAHHRAQLGVYLRMLEDRVPPTYGPTADATWAGADPTSTLDAARRQGA
jgi:DinB family